MKRKRRKNPFNANTIKFKRNEREKNDGILAGIKEKAFERKERKKRKEMKRKEKKTSNFCMATKA